MSSKPHGHNTSTHLSNGPNYRYLTLRERDLWEVSLQAATRIAGALWKHYHSRDVQAVATTLYTQALRTNASLSEVTDLARIYLECARYAAHTLPEASPDTVRRAAATLFIHHVAPYPVEPDPSGLGSAGESTDEAVSVSVARPRRRRSPESGQPPDVEILDLDL